MNEWLRCSKIDCAWFDKDINCVYGWEPITICQCITCIHYNGNIKDNYKPSVKMDTPKAYAQILGSYYR